MSDVFKPDLTPLQMLRLGVFGGNYFRRDIAEYPPSWASAITARGTRGPEHNAFGVLSGQSLEVWQANGWINKQDSRGWFQWYCRYSMGRRSADDARQIARHRAFVRHAAQVRLRGGGDVTKRVVQRQALLQWAYNPIPDAWPDTANVFKQVRAVLAVAKIKSATI